MDDLPGGGRPDSERGLVADLGSLRAQVNTDNVLDVRNALAAEALYLQRYLGWARYQLGVGEPGADLVSAPAASGFNGKIGVLRDQLLAYVKLLYRMASELDRTAQSYGYTEQQIKDSFGPYYDDYQAAAVVLLPHGPLGGPR